MRGNAAHRFETMIQHSMYGMNRTRSEIASALRVWGNRMAMYRRAVRGLDDPLVLLLVGPTGSAYAAMCEAPPM